MKNKNMLKFQAEVQEDTARLAQTMAECLPKKCCITLDGNLGAGKTFFSAALVHALGFADEVSSPTFTIVQEYRDRSVETNGGNGLRAVFHFDLYRLETEQEFFDAGLDEYFQSDALTLVEWAERLPGVLPENRLEMNFTMVEEVVDWDFTGATTVQLTEDTRVRTIHVRACGAEAEACLQAWQNQADFPMDLLIED